MIKVYLLCILERGMYEKIFLCLGVISFSFLICACNNKDNDIVIDELEKLEKPSGIINESEEENIELDVSIVIPERL